MVVAPEGCLEGLVSCKSMEGDGSEETCGVQGIPMIACSRDRVRDGAGGGRGGPGLAGRPVGRRPSALRPPGSSRSRKSQLERLYRPLRQSLGSRRRRPECHCQGPADAQLAEELKRCNAQARGGPETGQGQLAHAISTGESIRNERLPRDQRDLRRRLVEVQTNQAREMREAVEAHGRKMAEIPAQFERNLARLDEQYRSLKEQIRTATRRSGTRWPSGWRNGHATCRGRARRGARAVDAVRPGLGRPGLGRPAVAPEVPPVVRLRHGHRRPGRAARRRLRPTPG